MAPTIGRRQGWLPDHLNDGPCAFDDDTPVHRNAVGRNLHRDRPLSRWVFMTLPEAGPPTDLPALAKTVEMDVCTDCDRLWSLDVKHYGRPMSRTVEGQMREAPTNPRQAVKA